MTRGASLDADPLVEFEGGNPMVQQIKVNGDIVEADAQCHHPKNGRDNICPTRSGKCETCRYCLVTMTYADFLKLRTEALR